MGRDPLLKKKYLANLRARFRQQKAFYARLADAGIIRASSEKELVANLTNGWIVSDFWLTWLYISDAKITPERIAESAPRSTTCSSPTSRPRRSPRWRRCSTDAHDRFFLHAAPFADTLHLPSIGTEITDRTSAAVPCARLKKHTEEFGNMRAKWICIGAVILAVSVAGCGASER